MLAGQKVKQRYQIVKPIGSGGFGDTYLAEDLDLPDHPPCVVKHLFPKTNNQQVLDDARRLFEREAHILYQLGKRHQQIPTLFAYFEENQEFYLVQEFVDGDDLRSELIPGKKWREVDVICLLADILTVLSAVHQQDIIHRDIKPANLLRRRLDGHIVLIDFGAVKQISTLTMMAGNTGFTVAVGTPGYMPSEQAIGKPKLSSDIYAVGMIGIQALTGIKPEDLPDDRLTGEVLWRDACQVSDRTAEILDKMVKDHFSQRYPNAFEALKAIKSISTTKLKLALPPPPLPPRLKDQMNIAKKYEKSTILADNHQTTQPGASVLLMVQKYQVVTVDQKGLIIEKNMREAKAFREMINEHTDLEMIYIPGGSFVMGSPYGEIGRFENESPQHPVKLHSFWLGKYPITQLQYQDIMGTNPSFFIGTRLPVENVSWFDAVEFCQRLSEKTGKHYRLPTEAEWEYACRANTINPFHTGATIITTLANFNGLYTYGLGPRGVHRKHTTDVSLFRPNNFGLYDLHGNVWEWCQDNWHDNYLCCPTDASAWEGDTKDNLRIQRGGSWYEHPRNCRSASREKSNPNFSANNYGFRVALTDWS